VNSKLLTVYSYTMIFVSAATQILTFCLLAVCPFTCSFTIETNSKSNGNIFRPQSLTHQNVHQNVHHPLTITNAGMNDESETEYKNAATAILSNFMQKEEQTGAVTGNNNNNDNDNDENPVLSKIDFNAPKIPKVPISTLAAMLDAELYEKEWFVTGNVNPTYFDDTFEFQDPDVKLKGIEEYAKGVNKLFNQQTARAEIISTEVNQDEDDKITVTWRLSGKINIGPGLTIKPYICYTDFKVDTSAEGTGLITFQEDRFDIPGWDILLSSLFPFLIGKVTSEAAPPVPQREIPVMPKLKTQSKSGFDFESVIGQFFKK
jgi:hypothetical protein